MIYVTDQTGWSREYVAWKVTYPWVVKHLAFRKKSPSLQRSAFETASMLKDFFQCEDASGHSSADEVVKAEDAPEFRNLPTLTLAEAELEMRKLGMDPNLLKLLSDKEK